MNWARARPQFFDLDMEWFLFLFLFLGFVLFCFFPCVCVLCWGSYLEPYIMLGKHFTLKEDSQPWKRNFLMKGIDPRSSYLCSCILRPAPSPGKGECYHWLPGVLLNAAGNHQTVSSPLPPVVVSWMEFSVHSWPTLIYLRSLRRRE